MTQLSSTSRQAVSKTQNTKYKYKNTNYNMNTYTNTNTKHDPVLRFNQSSRQIIRCKKNTKLQMNLQIQILSQKKYKYRCKALPSVVVQPISTRRSLAVLTGRESAVSRQRCCSVHHPHLGFSWSCSFVAVCC